MRHQHAPSGSRVQRPGSFTPIHLLDDDVLLNVFDIYPEDISASYNDVLSDPDWDSARWWYKLAQVCRRWRYLILSSPVRLALHLVCTYGTPVAEMLAHSPPLPLIVNYQDDAREVTVEDEEAILLALQYRDRVRRIGLRMPATNLLKHIMAMSEPFPVLERLFMWPPSRDDTNLMLPATFQAPHLRQLSLYYVSLPMGSPLLSTATGLTYLELWDILPSAYFPPSYLVARLTSLPQLECLSIGFKFAVTTRAIESHPSHLVGPLVTLPNFRLCFFRGVRAYLEGFLARIRTPLLETLQIRLFNQPTFSFPHLLRFINTTENLRFRFARVFFFQELVDLTADRREGGRINPFHVAVGCRHIDWQVSAATQIFSALVPALSVVETLVLNYEEHDLPSEWDDDFKRARWRDLLIPFTKVKVLHVDGGLIKELSHSLRTEDEEYPPELLPELKELIYYKDGDPSDAFFSFVNARQIEGRPVTVFHHPPS